MFGTLDKQEINMLITFVETMLGYTEVVKYGDVKIEFDYWINGFEDETLALKLSYKDDMLWAHDSYRHTSIVELRVALNKLSKSLDKD